MTWCWFEWRDEGEFHNEATFPHIIIGAPKETAVEWWEDQYGKSPERVDGNTKAWSIEEKSDPDTFAQFIIGSVQFGGIGVDRERPAELEDMLEVNHIKVVMPDEFATWAHRNDVDPKTPSTPWVPEHAREHVEKRRGKPDFTPDPFEQGKKKDNDKGKS